MIHRNQENSGNYKIRHIGLVVTICCLSYFILRTAVGIQNSTALSKWEEINDDEPVAMSVASVEIPAPTPWKSIGGCGASGSGGTGDGIQWLGNGVQGGLVDLEVLSRYTIRKNYRQFSVTPRLSFKPTWTTSAGISAPVMSKSGSVQYQSNLPDNDRTTGGIGDITLDLSKSVGYSGTYRMQLSLTLPTGQYDIKRGPERNLQFLPVDFQMGAGVYSAMLMISRTIDIEDAFFKIDASYTHPFAMRPFKEENEMLDEYYQDYRDRTANERFYYRVKPYGESDLGAYTPPSVSLSGYYAYRGETGFVHSCGVSMSVPLGVAWIPEPSIHTYTPIKDPGHKTWSGAVLYGLEFSKPKYPLLLVVSIPIHDKPDDRGIINQPDWSDFLQQWVFAVGIKSTMF